MEYYNDLVTQKSWDELKKLNKTVDFVLIGGWAAYLYTKTLKSKDIDIIINYDQLEILSKNYTLYKNERLKKYEAVKDEVQIDIYLPHFSEIGISVDTLITKTISVEGFKVLDKNYLFALKIYTLHQRKRSPKGKKDLLDIFALAKTHVDLENVLSIIKKYHFENETKTLIELASETTHLFEIGLNTHQYSRLKKETLEGLKI